MILAAITERERRRKRGAVEEEREGKHGKRRDLKVKSQTGANGSLLQWYEPKLGFLGRKNKLWGRQREQNMRTPSSLIAYSYQ